MRNAKMAAAKKKAEEIVGKGVKIYIAKPKKKNGQPKRSHVFHIKVSIDTKTGEVSLEKKTKKPKKKELASDASPETA